SRAALRGLGRLHSVRDVPLGRRRVRLRLPRGFRRGRYGSPGYRGRCAHGGTASGRAAEMSPDGPVGIFDSGLGGLSVAKEVRRRLPRESILYIADSAHVPYGEKPLHQISERSLAVTGALIDRGAKIVVVACNTASGAALE